MPRKRLSKSIFDYPDIRKYIKELPEDKTFSIGQIYEEDAATTLSCVRCGTTEFIVGQGSYFTAISCPHCEWEIGIHDG